MLVASLPRVRPLRAPPRPGELREGARAGREPLRCAQSLPRVDFRVSMLVASLLFAALAWEPPAGGHSRVKAGREPLRGAQNLPWVDFHASVLVASRIAARSALRVPVLIASPLAALRASRGWIFACQC